MKLKYVALLITILFVSCKQEDKQQSKKKYSAAYKRYRESKLQYETYNEFYTHFKTKKIDGLPVEEGVTRRDPSSIILVDGLYYVWYTKSQEGADLVGVQEATDSTRAFYWDLCDIWYATSKDGYKWEEQGIAVHRGPKGSYDHRSVFTTDILVAKGKYYLAYQAAASLNDARWSKKRAISGDFCPNVIGMSVSDSPNGPWKALDKPILKVGSEDAWDGEVVHDPTFIVKGGKYYLYYKSAGRVPWKVNISNGEFNKEHADMPRAIIGVAIADNPEGPYIKSEYNPVLIGGQECIVWPYRNGVCSMLIEGPEKHSIQFSEDCINFYPMVHGITPPTGGACFRPGNFADIDEHPGQGLTWGISHQLWPHNHLVRFECNLSLERGNKVREKYQKLKEYQNSEGYEYDSALNPIQNKQ